MSPSRTRRVPSLAAAAVGALALAGLAGVTTPAGATAAAPGAAAAAPAAAAAAPEDLDASGPARTVKNEKQLRRAVLRANRNAGVDRIRLGARISFDPDRPTEGGPQRGDIDVTGDLVLRGSGRTIDADGVDRILDIRDGATVLAKRVTLRDGRAPDGESGGAVRVDATGGLDLRFGGILDSVAEGAGASGGAIVNSGGQVRVQDTRLVGNSAERAGGAIEAAGGSTQVSTSRLSSNSTGGGAGPGNGGAIHLTGIGNVDVVRSRVARNTAAAEGGGLWNSAEGSFMVNNTMLVQNTANGPEATNGGGALYNDGGSMTVDTSTLTDNTAPGTSGSGGGLLSVGGVVNVVESSLNGNSASRAGGGIEVADGRVTVRRSSLEGNSTGSAPGNGGGLHSTAPTSEVFVARSTVTGNTAASEGGGLWNGGEMTVRGTELLGNLAQGADATNGGGALFNNAGATMTVNGSFAEQNQATGAAGSGGGILNDQGTLTVTRSEITGNDAKRAGGGIEANVGDTTVSASLLSGNTTGAAPGNGGAFHLTGAGTVLVETSEVSQNEAANEGGGLWNSAGGTFTVRASDILGNTASGAESNAGGGGLYNDGGALTVEDSTIDDNSADGASGSGGGVLNVNGALVMSGTTLDGNDAVRAGGGIETNAGSVDLDDVDTTDNTTGANPGNGGGLHVTGAATVVWDTGTVTGNDAANQGGGIWNSTTGMITATNLVVEGNTAPEGPNVYNDGGPFTLNGAVVPPT